MYKKLMQKLSDVEFAKKLIGFQTTHEAKQFLKNEGFDATDEQINEIGNLLKKTAAEISDEALSSVAGGVGEEEMPELTDKEIQELLKYFQDNPDAAKELMGDMASELPLETRLLLYFSQAKNKTFSLLAKINRVINTPGAKANKYIGKGLRAINSWWQ